MSKSKVASDLQARDGSDPDFEPESDTDSESEPEPELTNQSDSCSVCGGRLADKPKKTFLGFRRFHCTECDNVEMFPLSTAYRGFYWLVVCVVGLNAVIAVLSLPSIAGAGNAIAYLLGRVSIYVAPCAFALVKDHRMRQQRQ